MGDLTPIAAAVEAAHARLSPSAGHRWMTCLGAIELEPTMPDKTSSYATHGTFLHGVSEGHLKACTSTAGETGDDEIVQFYIDYVRNVVAETKGDLYIEQRLKYSDDLWGTADAVIVADKVIHVVDLKTGSGVRVNAKANPQFLCYALMAVKNFAAIYGEFETVVMHCVQPALDHVDTWEIPV